MIHSLSGGVITEYDKLIYAFVEFDNGDKAWYISPFAQIKVGDVVRAPHGARGVPRTGKVERVEVVTKQTAPFPVNRTRELDGILADL
ncbi:MAG: hypothetical protein ACI4MH_01590 [Candidatus Coproplasma sp.]